MDMPEFSVSLTYLFCGSVLEGQKNPEYKSGDLIKCAKCGKENDYDSIVEVAKEEGITKIKEVVEDQLKKQHSDLFKK